MLTGPQIVHWSIRAALVCYVVVLAGNLAAGNSAAGNSAAGRQARWRRAAKWIWLAGCLLFLGHVAAAFHFYHHWSHAHAVAETARQTKAVIGWEFGEGLYFSYLFAIVWAVDALWWLARGEAYYERSRRITIALHAYMLFIGLNGAMVFESGVTRTYGFAACAVLGVLLVYRWMELRIKAKRARAS